MFCIFAMTKYLDDIEITLTLCVTVVMVDSNRSKRVNEFISLQDIWKRFVKDLKYTHLINILNVLCVGGKYFKIQSVNLEVMRDKKYTDIVVHCCQLLSIVVHCCLSWDQSWGWLWGRLWVGCVVGLGVGHGVSCDSRRLRSVMGSVLGLVSSWSVYHCSVFLICKVAVTTTH